jgi:hypothetical protein
MTNKDLISQYVDTGLGINKYQFDKLSNNDRRTYLRKRVISMQTDSKFLHGYEFSMLSDEQKAESIKYLDNDKLENTLNRRYDNEELIYGLIGCDAFINKMHDWTLEILTYSVGDKTEFIDLLLTKPNFISRIDSNMVSVLVSNSKNRDHVINFMIDNGLYKNAINTLLRYSPNQEETIDKLLNTKGFLAHLDFWTLDEFLHEVENPQDLVLKIASHRQETSEWGLRAIGILFEFTDEPYKLLTHIDIEYAKEFIRSMYDDDLNEFVESSENPRDLMAFIKSL